MHYLIKILGTDSMLRQQSFHIYGELLFLLLPNAWRISLHAQTGKQLEGHFQNVLKKKFRDCICIIDCSDIFIERPKNLTAHAQTWWNYKHNNTVKYLARVTPTGLVSFFLTGWGERVSDKQITLQSGF